MTHKKRDPTYEELVELLYNATWDYYTGNREDAKKLLGVVAFFAGKGPIKHGKKEPSGQTASSREAGRAKT